MLRSDSSWASCDTVVVNLLEEPSVAGLVVTTRDVTARRLLESELLEAQRLESVGRLAAGVAHEINTPVQYVGDNIRFLEEALTKLTWMLDRYRTELGADGDVSAGQLRGRLADEERTADIAFFEQEAPEAVRGALDGVERVARIVKAMKGVGYSDQNERGPVSVATVLDDALAMARSEYKHVAEVETDFADVPPVLGYAGDLSQVFLNLIVNAAHAIAEPGAQRGGRRRRAHRGQRLRHPRGPPRQDLRPVLHHQGGRPRHRAGSLAGAGDHREQARRRALLHLRGRPGDGVLGPASHRARPEDL